MMEAEVTGKEDAAARLRERLELDEDAGVGVAVGRGDLLSILDELEREQKEHAETNRQFGQTLEINTKAVAEIEQLRVQLAACGVAALGWSKENEAEPGQYGWSGSYGDVLKLRRQYETLQIRLRSAERVIAAGECWAAGSPDFTEAFARQAEFEDRARTHREYFGVQDA